MTRGTKLERLEEEQILVEDRRTSCRDGKEDRILIEDGRAETVETERGAKF
jgi:hypothetical protein